MAWAALAKGLIKREAKVMGANKVAARGKKMLSNRRKKVANRRASAQQIMGGGEEGEATTVRPTTSLIPKSSAIVPSSGGSSGGGGGGSKGGNLESINNSLMVVASTMKSNLTLDKSLHKEEEKAEEEQKRKEEEDRLEAEDPKKGPKEEQVKIPNLGFLKGIMGFFVKYLWSAVILKLVDFAANPMVIGIIKGLAGVGDFLINLSIGAIDVLGSFIHWGYKLVEMMKGFVTNIFGDEGAKKFDTFMGNLKNLINAFFVWKFIGQKIFKAIVKNITRVFKIAKAIISRAFKFAKNIASKVGKNLMKIPGVKNVVGKIGQFGGKLLGVGKGLASKGASKVGGFAAKIFGKAAKFVAPALKAATPAVKGFAGRIPILGPLIVGLVSLMSGEPAGQAIFKSVGAALGGALGTFIPIPILGTLIGETIGVFVGDLLYELILGGGVKAAGQKLKDTFTTLLSGGKAVFNWLKDGVGRFLEGLPKGFGLAGFLFNPNPLPKVKLMGKAFFSREPMKEVKDDPEDGKDKVKSPKGKASKDPKEMAKEMGPPPIPPISRKKSKEKNNDTINAVSNKASYEGGEGSSKIIPVPIPNKNNTPSSTEKTTVGSAKTKSVDSNDPSLLLYAGK